MKTCVTCACVETDGSIGVRWCMRRTPQVKVKVRIDPVDGSVVPPPSRKDLCALERVGGWLAARLTGRCGVEGRFWKPRNELSKVTKMACRS